MSETYITIIPNVKDEEGDDVNFHRYKNIIMTFNNINHCLFF
jgi:hypothetical protein